jgi:hypothetical protein
MTHSTSQQAATATAETTNHQERTDRDESEQRRVAAHRPAQTRHDQGQLLSGVLVHVDFRRLRACVCVCACLCALLCCVMYCAFSVLCVFTAKTCVVPQLLTRYSVHARNHARTHARTHARKQQQQQQRTTRPLAAHQGSLQQLHGAVGELEAGGQLAAHHVAAELEAAPGVHRQHAQRRVHLLSDAHEEKVLVHAPTRPRRQDPPVAPAAGVVVAVDGVCLAFVSERNERASGASSEPERERERARVGKWMSPVVSE